jgi:hypothetical protein
VGSRLVLRQNLHLVDYLILGLAGTSLAVFMLDLGGELTGHELSALLAVDLILVALYGSAFLFKYSVADHPRRWLRRNAINALGVLPLTIPILVPDRFFVVVQVVVIVLRFGEALDRAFGAQVLSGLFDRYRSMIVEELADPLLLRLAIALEEAVVSRDYAAAIGRRLDERRDLVEAAVARAIAASPKLSKISRFGPVQGWIDDTTKEVVDAAHAALTGPELNTLIREGFEEAFAELKTSIRERKWHQKGLGVTDVAKSVMSAGAVAPMQPPLR